MAFAFAMELSDYPPSCVSRFRRSFPMRWCAAPQHQCGRTRLGLVSSQGDAHPTPSTHAPMVYDWAHSWQERWLHHVRNWHYLSGGGGPDAGTLRAGGPGGGGVDWAKCQTLVRAGPVAPQHSGPHARRGSSHISLLMYATRTFTHVTSSSSGRGGPSLGFLVALLSLTTAWYRMATREDAAHSAQYPSTLPLLLLSPT